MRCNAAAGTRAPKSLSTKRRWTSRLSGQLHSDMAAEGGAHPIDFLHAEVRDERARDCKIERGAIVFGPRHRRTAPAPRKVGRNHPHRQCSEPLGEKVEVAAVARKPVHADHGSLGILESPCRVAHLREAMRAQSDEPPKPGTQRRPGLHRPPALVGPRGAGLTSCATARIAKLTVAPSATRQYLCQGRPAICRSRTRQRALQPTRFRCSRRYLRSRRAPASTAGE